VTTDAPTAAMTVLVATRTTAATAGQSAEAGFGIGKEIADIRNDGTELEGEATRDMAARAGGCEGVLMLRQSYSSIE